ncbi:MAG: peptidyl-prolyl cis-trans isomerase [Armatimonadota bacterium]
MRTVSKGVLLTVAAATVLSTLVVGCGKDSVATVDGVKISKQEYYERLEQQPAGVDQLTQKPMEAGAVVLKQMIDEKLLLRLAEKQKVSPTEEQVNERLAQIRKLPNFEARLKETGITIEQLKKDLLIQQAAFNIQVKGVKISDSKIKEYYDENKDTLFTDPESANVAAIFTKDKADSDKVVSLLKQGVDFATVAKQFSMDKKSAEQGGIIPSPIVREGGTPQILQDSILGTKEGEITKPIVLPGENGGYAIFKVLKHNDRRVKPLKEVEFTIRESQMRELAAKKNLPSVGEQLEKFKGEAKYDIKIAKYKSIVTPKKAEAGIPGVEGTNTGE